MHSERAMSSYHAEVHRRCKFSLYYFMSQIKPKFPQFHIKFRWKERVWQHGLPRKRPLLPPIFALQFGIASLSLWT